MAESNLKEMMVDDIAEDGYGDSNVIDNNNLSQIPWYMINSYGNFAKVCDLFITILLIYDHFAVPVILVYNDVYQTRMEDGSYITEPGTRQETLRSIELFIDIFMTMDIIANFFKWTRGNKTLGAIAEAYIKSGVFFFDVIATLPNMFMGEGIQHYGLKVFRIVHFFRITQPLELVLSLLI